MDFCKSLVGLLNHASNSGSSCERRLVRRETACRQLLWAFPAHLSAQRSGRDRSCAAQRALLRLIYEMGTIVSIFRYDSARYDSPNALLTGVIVAEEVTARGHPKPLGSIRL